MHQPEVIHLNNLDGNAKQRAIIRHDFKSRNRIFCQFPPYCSLTHEQAIALANRLADLLEESEN